MDHLTDQDMKVLSRMRIPSDQRLLIERRWNSVESSPPTFGGVVLGCLVVALFYGALATPLYAEDWGRLSGVALVSLWIVMPLFIALATMRVHTAFVLDTSEEKSENEKLLDRGYAATLAGTRLTGIRFLLFGGLFVLCGLLGYLWTAAGVFLTFIVIFVHGFIVGSAVKSVLKALTEDPEFADSRVIVVTEREASQYTQ